ncbi:MAG TPA: hypothetical protein EYG80_02190 [Flavobacteriaceae bacterium]|nr:hypothetical protein [Flavobacteriaceae bacterium]
MKKVIVLISLMIAGSILAQEKSIPEKKEVNKIFKKINSRKGQFFASWGWNRGSFGKSDITFSGDNYNFTLKDVVADDKPNPFGIKFFSPGDVTLPQTNYRFGYFIKDNYNIILGVDHMKYVMRANQSVNINGNINVGSALYDGNYDNQMIVLSTDFLKFEHTDGLNYIFVGVNRFDNFNKLLGIHTDKFEVNLEEGIDIGIHMPRTNTTLLNKERYDEFHVSGFGFSAKAGLNLTFYKHFYLQADMKYGYVNMSDIRTTNSKSDRAKQSFGFFEAIYSFGWRFNIN